jgi:hypothetical protein
MPTLSVGHWLAINDGNSVAKSFTMLALASY